MRPSCSTSDTGITHPAFSAPIAEPGTGIVNAASFDAAQSLVLRHIQKMQKPASGRPFPLILLFVREIISERHRVLRGNPRQKWMLLQSGRSTASVDRHKILSERAGVVASPWPCCAITVSRPLRRMMPPARRQNISTLYSNADAPTVPSRRDAGGPGRDPSARN
jgi:hypothetical protein